MFRPMNQPLTPWALFLSEDRMRKYCVFARVRPPTLLGRFEAASLTFPEPENGQLVHKAAAEYQYHPFVIDELARLATAEPVDALPTREQQARDIYNLANDTSKSPDDRHKFHKLYADLMGFVQKPGGDGGNTYIQQRVMMFPVMPRTPEDIAELERHTIEQQARLVRDASQ